MIVFSSKCASTSRRCVFSRLLWILSACLISLWGGSLWAREFTVAVYNVENLFDADGLAAYDDYQPSVYKPAHLRTKILNTAEALARLTPDGKGPDVILFQEIEVDHTPPAQPVGPQDLIAPDANRRVEDLLPADTAAGIDAAHADWPAEAWLLKAVEQRGLTGYTVVCGTDGQNLSPEGKSPAIKNVIFTRFPVLEVRNHPIEGARNILEVLVSVDGVPVRLFGNHWKSGASDAKTEVSRVANARVLRARLEEILAKEPSADIIIGGDFNSQYNQSARYPQMPETGMNTILRSQGDERALQRGTADLYNLWFDLPPAERGSDTYRGEWGTLMQMLVSRGLYDCSGVQYVDNSFQVGRIPGLNVYPEGTPRRWNRKGQPAGAGFSDHLPILARFRTLAVSESNRSRWMELQNPSEGHVPTEALRTPERPEPKGK